MAMSVGGPSGGPVSEINVTPMIDVMLVLIIVFMIIHAASQSVGEDALVPQPPSQPGTVPPPTRTIVVELVKSGADRAKLTINQEPVTWESLRERLFAIYKTRAERVMFVKADKELPFEDVAAVIDIAHVDIADMKVGLLTAAVESAR